MIALDTHDPNHGILNGTEIFLLGVDMAFTILYPSTYHLYVQRYQGTFSLLVLAHSALARDPLAPRICVCDDAAARGGRAADRGVKDCDTEARPETHGLREGPRAHRCGVGCECAAAAAAVAAAAGGALQQRVARARRRAARQTDGDVRHGVAPWPTPWPRGARAAR